jgi:hypothetical protein
MADEDIELLKLFCYLGLVSLDALDLITKYDSKLLQDHIREQRRLCRSLPSEKTRPTWMEYCNRVPASHFRKQFRMTRDAFTNLCSRLRDAVGEAKFRPENALIQTRNSASLFRRGGLIPGEIKVALSIRLLAGGSYLDLMPLFDVSTPRIYVILDEFLDWVLTAFSFPLVRRLQQKDCQILSSTARKFSFGSNGAFSGIIGALDGIAIRIRAPPLTEVSDPGNYYCRKGFFALNVQAICDRSKRFLWCYPSNKGSTHDSTAFVNSRLYTLLTQNCDWLREAGYYILGDSAYNLTPFLLIPYSTEEVRQDPTGMRDSFNFFHSSSRIYIECAFGELVLRWGILWRPLAFSLLKCQKVVQVCMHLHNHIKDQVPDDSNWLHTAPTEIRDNGAWPWVTDNDAVSVRGRRPSTHEGFRSDGEDIRQSIALHLQFNGLRRPLHSGMEYNQYGHVYFGD